MNVKQTVRWMFVAVLSSSSLGPQGLFAADVTFANFGMINNVPTVSTATAVAVAELDVEKKVGDS